MLKFVDVMPLWSAQVKDAIYFACSLVSCSSVLVALGGGYMALGAVNPAISCRGMVPAGDHGEAATKGSARCVLVKSLRCPKHSLFLNQSAGKDQNKLAAFLNSASPTQFQAQVRVVPELPLVKRGLN